MTDDRDPLDVAASTTEVWNQRHINAVRADIPAGAPGDCKLCGKEFGRLVGGACPPCLDKHGLD